MKYVYSYQTIEDAFFFFFFYYHYWYNKFVYNQPSFQIHTFPEPKIYIK